MGLDQYAYLRPVGEHDETIPTEYSWRKHPRLQVFMEDLFAARTGQQPSELNCQELSLTEADIDALEGAVTEQSLPASDGGFFYGNASQDSSAEHYREQDLAFCAAARDVLSDGGTVSYSCWW